MLLFGWVLVMEIVDVLFDGNVFIGYYKLVIVCGKFY